MKICLFQKRPYDFVGESTGERVQGTMYAGFLENGTPIEFSSSRDHKVYDIASYEEEKSVSLPIKAKFFQGVVKYRELDSSSS